MADFNISYEKYVKPAEGGYVNDPVDKGGETYAGISRKFHPTWGGWVVVDFEKKHKGQLKTNQFIKGLDGMVREFYYNLYKDNGFDKIQDQNVADIYFDWFVNSGRVAIKRVQEMLGVTVDGNQGPKTLEALNKSQTIYTKIHSARKLFYERIVEKNPTQKKFFNGWMARLAMFPVPKPSSSIVFIAAAVFLFFLFRSK